MARDFLGMTRESTSKSTGYMDGFRFGLGQFVAWIFGLALVGGVTIAVMALLKLHA